MVYNMYHRLSQYLQMLLAVHHQDVLDDIIEPRWCIQMEMKMISYYSSGKTGYITCMYIHEVSRTMIKGEGGIYAPPPPLG